MRKYLFLLLLPLIGRGQFNPIFFLANNPVSTKVGLVAYYKFDSNSNDYSGDTHNGIDANISYANVGKVGNSATFNGTTSFIYSPQSIDFDFNKNPGDLPFSIS